MNKPGFIFSGKTTKDVLKQVWEAIQTQGQEYQSQRGPVRSIKGTMMVITDPLNEAKNYPYWDKQSDDWYQDNFVRKETNTPPETIKPGSDIYAYKYVWRSRFYDGGVGHVKGVVDVLKKAGISKTEFKKKEELVELLKKTYQLYHPELILAVLSWKGKELLNFYLENPQILDLELKRSRRDTLQSVIDEIKSSPASRRAITPSFTYEQIDHSGAAGGVPVYQNYQLYVNFDKKGNPKGLVSMHLHRAMDALGGTQLDITHDREWGTIASKQLGLPLEQIIIYCNDIYYHVPKKGAQKDLATKTDIKGWLHTITDAYDPKKEDIEKRLSSPISQTKIAIAWSKLR
jgi:hypothetical protein